MKKQTKTMKFKTVEELAALSMSQSELAKAMLQDGEDENNVIAKIGAAIAGGAPVNPDGTVPVAKFVGWLIERTK